MMPSEEESGFCSEIAQMTEKIGKAEKKCITNLQAFEEICLNPNVLQVAYNAIPKATKANRLANHE